MTGSERAQGDGRREVRDGRVAAVLATTGARHAHGREASRQAMPEQHHMVLRYVSDCHGVQGRSRHHERVNTFVDFVVIAVVLTRGDGVVDSDMERCQAILV